MTHEPEVALRIADARIAWVLDHAGMSPWLKQALRGALEADPVGVGNDVEVLRSLVQERARAWARDQLQVGGQAPIELE